jgi:hypothetical protein
VSLKQPRHRDSIGDDVVLALLILSKYIPVNTLSSLGMFDTRLARILLAHDGIVWVRKVLENEAPDAIPSCLSGTGGRARCQQIISQDCSGFKGIA